MPIPNPVFLNVFGFDLLWYGLLIACGILLATLVVYRRAPRHGIPAEKVLDMILFSVPCGIVGARLYYVVFHWSEYSGDVWKILNLRLGGLAIHGGLIFGLGMAVFLCFRLRIRPLQLLDLTMPAIALAQSIGRWGNYFNSEAYGSPTDLPWAVTIDGQTMHPTFLYESLWCFALFWFLLWVDKRRRFAGQIFLLYGILYSAERFFVEALRTDSLMLGPFKQAQVLSLVVLFVFATIFVVKYRNETQKKLMEEKIIEDERSV